MENSLVRNLAGYGVKSQTQLPTNTFTGKLFNLSVPVFS